MLVELPNLNNSTSYFHLFHTLTFLSSKMTNTVTEDISYAELKALLGKSSSLFLVDVRRKEEYDNGHIPGSVHIPLDTVEAALSMSPEEFKAKYGVAKPETDAPELVFHCQMGKRGEAATKKAREMGYKNARNYLGAFKEWSEKEGK